VSEVQETFWDHDNHTTWIFTRN